MKFTIERSALFRALSHVQSAVERRNTIPILANVLMDLNDGALTLSTTDMDLEIRESVPALITASGSATAPAHTLYDIVRKIPDNATVAFDLPEGQSVMTVTADKSVFKLGCLPTADFPQLSVTDMPVQFSLPAASLRSLIDKTAFAISTEETRYYLNGIYIHALQVDTVWVLRAVATDGHRLARFQMPAPEGAEKLSGIIIPRKTIGELRKLIDEAADEIRIEISDTKIRFTFDHVIMTSKLIDGTFPDYERVIPPNNDKILEINPRVFSNAVDRVSTISTEKTRAVKMQINGKVMILSANSPESGSAVEELEIQFDSPALEIGFNSRYLLDITKQMESNGCRIRLADPSSPTIIQDIEDDSSLYVLMPMRV